MFTGILQNSWSEYFEKFLEEKLWWNAKSLDLRLHQKQSKMKKIFFIVTQSILVDKNNFAQKNFCQIFFMQLENALTHNPLTVLQMAWLQGGINVSL